MVNLKDKDKERCAVSSVITELVAYFAAAEDIGQLYANM